jgi:hypothetical protein
MSFWDLIKPQAAGKAKAAPKPAGSAELAVALEEAKAAAAEAIRLAAEVAERRQTFLIGGTDDQLDHLDRELAGANRSVDKCEAAVEALQARLADAVEREHREGLDRLYAEGEAALRAGAEAYTGYDRLARQMVPHLLEMRRRHDQVRRVQHDLEDAGDPRRIPDLDDAMRPQTAELRIHKQPLWAKVWLAHPTDPLMVIYPQGIDTFGQPVPVDEEEAK